MPDGRWRGFFQKYAQDALDSRKGMLTSLADMEHVPRGSITVGANEGTCLHILPEVFADFKKRYPDVSVNIKRADYAKILESVTDNSVDFGIVSLPVRDNRLTTALIHQDELVVIAPPRHPIGMMKSAPVRELAEYPLVLPKTGHTRDALDNLFRERGLKPNYSMELDSSELLKRFVAAGVGVGFIARSNVQEDVRAGVLAAVPMADALLRRDLALVYRKDKALSRASLAFIDIAKSHKSNSVAAGQNMKEFPAAGISTLMGRCLLLVAFFSLFFLPVDAQTSSAAGAAAMPSSAYKLIAVTVTGSKRFTSEQIALASGLPVGTVAHDPDFKKAARQLGESGAFVNIAYTFSYSVAGTTLEFQVTDADKFVPARFSDFVWFRDEELLHRLRERIPLFDGTLPVSGRLAEEVSDVLQALLVANGVPGHVEYVRTIAKGGEPVAVDYSVAGVSIRVRDVEFPGATASELPLLQAAAETLSDREYSHALLTSFVEQSLLPIYRERGYLKAASALPQLQVVKLKSLETGDNRQPPTFVDVSLPVTLGLQYKVAGWEWSGNKAISSESLKPYLHARAGQTANTVELEKDLRAVQESYSARGHLLATVKANEEFNDTEAAVSYNLAVEEGPVFYMGELEFRGIDNNLTARLRAAWKIRPGEVYDATYLKQFLPQAMKLLPAGLDWEVSPHVTAIAKDKTVDVDLQYTAKAPE